MGESVTHADDFSRVHTTTDAIMQEKSQNNWL